MCPFNGLPEGFTPETLALLDRSLQSMWDDLAAAVPKAAAAPVAKPVLPRPAARPRRRTAQGKHA